MSGFPSAWPGTPAPSAQSARGVLLPVRFCLFAAVAIACCGLSAFGLLRGAAVAPLAIAAVAIAMWHGAYDQVQGEQLLDARFGRRWLLVFLLGYAGLAGLTLLGWFLLPYASLVLFLAYSAWHFGTEPEETTPSPLVAPVALALGALPIVAACRWHPKAVVPIFAQMLGAHAGSHAAALTSALAWTCGPVVGVASLGLAAGVLGRSLAERAELAAVAALQVALFAFCNPLVAFAVYFCCWHTPEHLVATSLPERRGETLRSNLRHNFRVGLIPWLFSLGFLVLAFCLGRHEASAYQGELFVVLSALTVPHMALNELRRARSRHHTSSRGHAA